MLTGNELCLSKCVLLGRRDAVKLFKVERNVVSVSILTYF